MARLTGEKGLLFEMIKTSAEILRSAKREGYIDDELKFTGKQLERDGGKEVKGFQKEIVCGHGDIAEEIQFFRDGGAARVTEMLGADGWDTSRLIEGLRNRD